MKQIIAMGGGGFSMEPDNLALDRYIVEQAKTTRPRVCYLPTAGGESAEYIVRFYVAFTGLQCRPSHLSLFAPHTADLASFLLEQDVIYVGGGNTKSMLALWREWNVDQILRQAWEAGVILAGLSAGAICWFEQGVTDSIPGALRPLDCLGFLAGSCCPHYDGEAERRPAFETMIRSGELKPGYGVDDGVALHFVDDTLKCAVASRPNAQAYRVSRVGPEFREDPVPARYLG